WAAFSTHSFLVTAPHVVLTAFMTGAFIVASIAAYKMIRTIKNEKVYRFHRMALLLALIIGGIFSVVTSLNGHES
ncbi:cytochrome ubiquinol oxidase subunit I, partial [Bacillus atrophaeus]